MDDDAVFALAATIEGHPDNVAPAFYGGFTIARAEGGTFHATSVSVDPRVQVVVSCRPTRSRPRWRGLLPDSVPHADAAANAGRAALLVAALSRQPELLHPATEDFLHQRYREPAMPASLRLVDALRADGVPAVVLRRRTDRARLRRRLDPGRGRGPRALGLAGRALAVDRDGVRVTARG